MKRIAKFEKVSFEQFKKDWLDTFENYPEDKIKEVYDNIMIPVRATSGSAGYDFHTPVSFILKPNETIKIPTGIRVRIDAGWMLGLYPRSGLGFKYRMQINNTF